MAPDETMLTTDEASSSPGRPERHDRPHPGLVLGAALMALSGVAMAVGLVEHASDYLSMRPALPLWARLADAVLDTSGVGMYLLAIVFLLISALLLVTRPGKAAPLALGLMSIAVMLVITVTVLGLDIAPYDFGGRLTSGRPVELALIYAPLVALLGWLVAAATVARAVRPAAAGSSSPSP